MQYSRRSSGLRTEFGPVSETCRPVPIGQGRWDTYVNKGVKIDTRFDVRSDSGGRDPDQHSLTLRNYHQLLWRKPLPTGPEFRLQAVSRPNYLIYYSPDGDFFLSSDTIARTFNDMARMQSIVGQLSERSRAAFNTSAYTVGGTTLFPGNRVDGKPSINGARACTRRSRTVLI